MKLRIMQNARLGICSGLNICNSTIINIFILFVTLKCSLVAEFLSINCSSVEKETRENVQVSRNTEELSDLCHVVFLLNGYAI